jgi:penicillin-binding protein 1A
MAAALFASACSVHLAPVDLAEQRRLPLRSTITAAGGRHLASLFRENRVLTSIDRVPKTMINALVAAEDARFFHHDGYDLRAIARAALVNLSNGEVSQGGSTITQQYVKNTFFRDPARTLERKAEELRLAIEVERRYTKREILERYLNTVYFGEGAYGIKTAAETYFDEPVHKLSLRKAALLASIVRSPATYDPREHPGSARRRRDYVLDRMTALGHLSRRRAGRAKKGPLGVVSQPPRLRTKEPYFVEAVKREVLEDKRLGRTALQRERSLWRGGLTIESTLVPRLQAAAESAVRSVLNAPGDPEAALVALRPSTGEVVAMVGGRDWSASQVNLALGREGGGSGRQPGSAFKPIVAATALESGSSFDDTYDSGPARFSFSDGSTWTVTNAEGGSYGRLPLDEAMVRSVNGVYARLAIDLGPAQIASQAEVMGVEADLPAVPSIALGSAEVSVLDIAAAYATLANRGTAIEPTTIRRIRLHDGEVITPDQQVVPQAVAPGNAYLVTKVLQEVIRRGTGRAAFIGRPAAGKTGTTNDYADAWFAGYTPDLVAAVWVGYPQGRIPMTSVHGVKVLGGTFPASIWRAFMLEALRGSPRRPFTIPRSELTTVFIDPESGLLAAPWCAPGVEKTMLRQLVPTEYCPQPPPEPEPVPIPIEPPSASRPDRAPARAEPSPSPDATPTPEPEGSASPSPSPDASPSPTPSPGSGDDPG